MSRDIVPELLEAVQSDFIKGLKKSPRLRKIQKQIEEGNVSFTEANNYAIEVGEILSRSLQDHIKADILPDGKMYYNIAKRIMEPVLGKNYELISEVAVKVQGILNKKAKMRILPQKPKLNQDRINGFVEKLSSEDDFRKVQFMLGDQVVNFSQSIVDETIEKNAKFHFKSGFSPKIIRKPESRACKWCRGLGGTYEYPDKVNEEVYKRHPNCRCTVEYVPDNGSRQNVHTKRILTESEVKEREKRKNISSDIKKLNFKNDKLQYRKYVSVLDYENMPKSVAEFQEMKYNSTRDYDKLKSNYYVKNNIKKGVWGNKINREKQAPHNELTREVGKSYLYKNINSQDLFDRYAGRGILEKTLTGKYSNKEICSSDVAIGIDFRTGRETKMFKIHHSKNRTHIVPYIEKE